MLYFVVSVVGWLFIGGSALMVFSAGMAGVVWFLLPAEVTSEPFGPPGSPPAFRLMDPLFAHFGALVVLQLVVAAAGIAAGIGLLRLRAWGRALAERLTWFGIATTVGYGALWIASFTSLSRDGAASTEDHAFLVIMAVMGLVALIAYLVPMIAIVAALRGETIRTAVRRAGPDRS